MTRRARWYLMIGAVRHAIIGTFAIGFASQWTAAAFVPIVSYAPMWVWGLAMLFTSTFMTTAAKLKSARWARAALICSASITLALGMGIAMGTVDAWLAGKTVTPVTATLLLSLAFKDFAVCTQPMRSPFEPLLRREPDSTGNRWPL